MSEQKSEATFFKEDVERIIARYGRLSAYATIGALEVVKQNIMDRLANQPPFLPPKLHAVGVSPHAVWLRHVIPVGDNTLHDANRNCCCAPIETNPGLWVHNAHDGREKYERQDGKERGGWQIIFEK